ncbi:MAG TPA: hypothetical protein VIT24_13725 [Acidimicrobiales bacterium]
MSTTSVRRRPSSVVRLLLAAVIAATLAAAFETGAASEAGAAAQTAPEASPQGVPLLVGDSLSYAAKPLLPTFWRVRAWPGMALHEALDLLLDSSPRSARCVVVALGSNDVGDGRTAAQMRSSIVRVNEMLPRHPCVLWTTVKVHGVHSMLGSGWDASAERWNRVLAQYADGTILDWDAIARAHPGWFVPDGLHMRRAGRIAYANLLRAGVQAGS